MYTMRHPRLSFASFAGMGLMLVSLFGCLTIPTGSVSGFESPVYQDYQAYQHVWGDRDDWGHRHGRSYRERGYEMPDRYTIHKGKKCELRCERVWGSRDYRCREYRC
jgi:hypothetical protein